MVRDCLLSVRPKMIILQNYAESQEAVEELKKHFMSKIESEIKPAPLNVGELNPIEEKDEIEVEFIEGNDEEGEDEERESSEEESQTFEGGNPSSQSQG